MQCNAHLTVYQPGIDADIDDFVNRCSSCFINKPNQPNDTMQAHDVPDGPCKKTGIDFFNHRG